MTPPGRQPPPVVPTLTDVVPHSSDTAVPWTGDGPSPPTEPPAAPVLREVSEPEPALLDALTDRVMAGLLPRLQACVAQALQDWCLAQVNAGARTIADAVRDEIAHEVREAIASALGTTRK